MNNNKIQSPFIIKFSNLIFSRNSFQNFFIILLFLIIGYLSFELYHNIYNIWGKKNNLIIEEKKKTDTIQVEVLNGCGVEKAGEIFTSYLRKNNFDVIKTGNYISIDINNTLIIDRSGNRNKAIIIADSLGIEHKNVIQQLNKKYYLDVSIIIGKDLHKLKPYNLKEGLIN
ncbi:MAG: hypothetical protein STSR0008_04310 [Ignavibacterium sp.]